MTVPVPGSLTYSYDEDGVTTVFPYPVRFLEPQELTVIREVAGAQTVLAYNVDYTVSGAGNPSGGSIVRTAVTNGGKIIIARSTEWKQIVDLEDKARNPAQAVEDQLDRLTMAGQDTNERLGGKADAANLAPVAFSGDYDDLDNKPVIPPGTVTSVGLSAPAGFTVSGSPVVGSGTISFSYSSGYQGYTTAEANKLAGIAAGATANQSNAFLLNRANHTGVQAISTVTGLQSALDGKADKAITISAGTGLSGGGSLAANRTLALSAASQAAIAAAITAVQPGDLAAVATSGSYADLANIPSTFAPSAHTHPIGQVTGLQAVLDDKADEADLAGKFDVPAGTISQYVRGDGSLAAFPTLGTAASANVSDFATAAQGGKADTAVQHSDLGDLATKDKVAISDIDASGTPSSTTFLRGDGVWSPGGGGGGGDVVGPSSATDGEMALFDGVSGKLLKGGGLPFDGAYSSLAGIPSTFAPSAHTHPIGQVTGLQAALDDKADDVDLAGKFDNPTGTTSQYIRGDGSLATFPSIPAGTVTSVGLSAPTGLSVSGSPVTGAGTLTLSYVSGYTGFTTTLQSKLNGIEAGATANQSDAYLLDRANHTGVMPLAGLDSSSSGAGVIGRSGASGNYVRLTLASAATANSVPYRGAGGVLAVGAPTDDAHAATKKYVDDNAGITPDQIAAGAVGSIAMVCQYSSTDHAAGNTVAGSSLYIWELYSSSNITDGSSGTPAIQTIAGALTGTWRWLTASNRSGNATKFGLAVRIA